MKIKGTSIASFLAFLGAEFGPAKTREFLTSLEPNLRKRCEGLILASAFYPIEELEALARSAHDYFGANATFYERSGAHNASLGLSGVHQALLSRPTPIDFLKAAERSWAQFTDSGTVSVEGPGEGQARIRIGGFPGSIILCGRQTGFLTRALELSGAREVVVKETLCTRNAAPYCEWEVTWDAESSPRPQSLTTGLKRPAFTE